MLISNGLKKLVENGQKVISKTNLANMSKSEKSSYSVTFLLITFLCIFLKPFQRIRNQREVLRCLIPILNV